jgi:2,4-dienoyl-CoA reductase-like NADH-dependent reductase (Old Yellow Enzyme family)/thioredoxin reductase
MDKTETSYSNTAISDEVRERYGALLEPLTIRDVTIRNRIMSTAHTSGAGSDGVPGARYQRYHEEKARGGIGLTIVGGSTAVAPDTPGAGMLHLDASTDRIVPHYRRLAERVHAHGASIFAQLAHMGRRAGWDGEHWLPPIAPSRVREPAHRSFPKEMEESDLRRTREAFAAAAGRVKRAGIEGIELSATHGHLHDQFWSPRTNRRDDRYGGRFANRLRFTLEVIEAIREVVGPDFVVGMRMSGDELIEGGLSGEECVRIARELTRNGGIDFLSVLGAQAESLPSHAVIFPGMTSRPAPFLGLAGTIKRAVEVPVFYAQRVNDLATAARAIEDGEADMVAMTRAHMADPHIVRKLVEGRIKDIRPCVGANYCIDRLYAGKQALCLHNPATGREQSTPHEIPPASRRRRVVVVGAGPAGLEAARVSAARGHVVVLFEREPEVGGQLRIASRAEGRGGLRDIVRWLQRQVGAAEVDLRLGCEAGAEEILELKPDVVVLATGGVPAPADMPGAQAVESVEGALRAPVVAEERVLLFDDNGAEAGLSCAHHLARRGASVEFVTADPAPGALLERTTRPVFMKGLYREGVRFTPDTRLEAVESRDGGRVALLRNEYDGAEAEREVDRVVVDYGSVPAGELYEELKPGSVNLGELDLDAFVGGRSQRLRTNPEGGYQLFRIGDAVASRNVHAAIYDGLRLCMKL